MGMKLETLHSIIDVTQASNREIDYEVAVIDYTANPETGKPKVFQVDEVYVNNVDGIISLVVVPAGDSKEDANV